MDAIVSIIHKNPDIALYLTLALGFSLGKLKIGKFNLGIVTTTLICGLIIGQIGVQIPHIMQSTFFALFLFTVGYSVGPQFIRALRSDGIPQVVHAIIVCTSGLATAFILGKLLGYDTALTTGLLSGGYTNSTVLGVGTNLVGQMGMSKAAAATALTLMPVAYAVTYPFGTAGSAWVLANLAPKMFKFDIAKVCREYEEKHGKSAKGKTANIPFASRVYTLANTNLAGKTVSAIEAMLPEGVYVRRARILGNIVECHADTVIPEGASIAVAGASENLVSLTDRIGAEASDKELLDFVTDVNEIVVTNKSLIGKTLGQLTRTMLSKPAHGLFPMHLARGDEPVAMTEDTVLEKGDVLTVQGRKEDVATAASQIGYFVKKGNVTDIPMLGFAIVIGSLIGAITIHIAGIPFSISTAVGAIVAGIICGQMRTKVKDRGFIPKEVIWVFNNLGLNGFIACVGLNAATGFVSGLEQYGLTLFIAGMFVTLVPLFVGLFLGHYVFKFHPGILLGACAGSRSTTAAIGAVLEVSKSDVPVVGYTVGYSVSRVVMAIYTIVLMTAF